MQSVFTNKAAIPTEKDLQQALGETFAHWNALVEFVLSEFPDAKQEWKFSGEKFGWSFRLNDKKRAIVYLLPRAVFFKTAFVFGQKAENEILNADIADEIKNELRAAKKYVEGKGIRIDVKTKAALDDIKKLVHIKLRN